MTTDEIKKALNLIHAPLQEFVISVPTEMKIAIDGRVFPSVLAVSMAKHYNKSELYQSCRETK